MAAEIPPREVADAFVNRYYTVLRKSPEKAHKFYAESSRLGWPESDGVITPVTTLSAINKKILSSNYKNCFAEIKTWDAQASQDGGVFVAVTGSFLEKEKVMTIFFQTFFLAKQEKGFFILNDILRVFDSFGSSADDAQTVQIEASDISALEDTVAKVYSSTSSDASAEKACSVVEPAANANVSLVTRPTLNAIVSTAAAPAANANVPLVVEPTSNANVSPAAAPAGNANLALAVELTSNANVSPVVAPDANVNLSLAVAPAAKKTVPSAAAPASEKNCTFECCTSCKCKCQISCTGFKRGFENHLCDRDMVAKVTPRQVANAFVQQYYMFLRKSPEKAHKFYAESSLLGWPESDGVITPVTTLRAINDKILSSNYKNCSAEVDTLDAQASQDGGVFVAVTGSFLKKEKVTTIFFQIFFLARQEKGFFILNDILRVFDSFGSGADDAQTVQTSDICALEDTIAKVCLSTSSDASADKASSVVESAYEKNNEL